MLKKGILLSTFLSLFCASSIGAQNRDFKHGENLDIFFNVYNSSVINYVDTINTTKSIKKAIDAFFSTLDPYAEYYDEKDIIDFQTSVTGKYGGVGSIIRQHYLDTTSVQISEVYKGAPADKVGLKPGDKIISIDGHIAKGMTTSKVSSLMKGDAGTSVTMVVAPIGDSTIRKEVIIKREQIAINAVDYYTMLSDSVGYVSLLRFSKNCSEEVKSALKELQAKGMRSIILDLRSNGGGILDEACKVLSLFVPKGSQIVSVKGRDTSDVVNYKTTTSPLFENMPLVVMVNRNSASASEIVAGAIQDLDRGVVVGQRTFGKGLVQSSMDVGHGSSIKITTAKYYIPSGRCIQALDYTHRNEDGSVGKVPDSLITEFKTLKGRKVYDGGGILPDTVLTAKKMGRFVTFLYITGYLDDFSFDYFAKHKDAPSIETFKLSDSDWADFKAMLKNKTLNYSFESEANLKKLIESTKAEGYYEDIKPLIEQIESKIEADTDKHLDLNRAEISEYIESSIIKNYHYASGSVAYGLKHDEELKVAEFIASNKQNYDKELNL